MGGTLLLVLGLAGALFFIVRERPVRASEPEGSAGAPPATFLTRYGPQLRLAAAFVVGLALAFIVVDGVLRAWISVAAQLGSRVGLGPGWVTMILIAGLMTAGLLTAARRKKRVGDNAETSHRKPGSRMGWLIIAGCIGVVIGAAALNWQAFNTVGGWARTATGGEAPALKAARPDAPTPMPEATPSAALEAPASINLEARLARLAASVDEARQVKLKIATDIDTPEARERLERMPNLRGSFNSHVRSHEQFVYRARAYAELSLDQIVEAAVDDRAAVEQAVQQAKAKAGDPKVADMLQTLLDNLKGPNPRDAIDPTMAAWERLIETGENPQHESPEEQPTSAEADPQPPALQPSEPAYSRRSGTAWDRRAQERQ